MNVISSYRGKGASNEALNFTDSMCQYPLGKVRCRVEHHQWGEGRVRPGLGNCILWSTFPPDGDDGSSPAPFNCCQHFNIADLWKRFDVWTRWPLEMLEMCHVAIPLSRQTASLTRPENEFSDLQPTLLASRFKIQFNWILRSVTASLYSLLISSKHCSSWLSPRASNEVPSEGL